MQEKVCAQESLVLLVILVLVVVLILVSPGE